MGENNHHKIKLNQNQIEYLSNLPETGMGYQLVDITLKNGSKLKNKKVLNSEYLLLEETDITPNQIENLELSENR